MDIFNVQGAYSQNVLQEHGGPPPPQGAHTLKSSKYWDEYFFLQSCPTCKENIWAVNFGFSDFGFLNEQKGPNKKSKMAFLVVKDDSRVL